MFAGELSNTEATVSILKAAVPVFLGSVLVYGPEIVAIFYMDKELAGTTELSLYGSMLLFIMIFHYHLISGTNNATENRIKDKKDDHDASQKEMNKLVILLTF